MPVGVGAKPAGGAAPAAVRPAAPAAKPAAPPSQPPAGSEGGKGGKKKLIVIIVLVVVLLVGLAVGVFFVLKALGILGGGGNGNEPAPTPTASEMKLGKTTVTTGEAININLDEGYLSFAATIYFDESVDSEGEIDPSPARGAAYRLFKGMSREELDKPGAIAELEEKYLDLLNKEVIPPYNGHVAAVRFTQFAYQ